MECVYENLDISTGIVLLMFFVLLFFFLRKKYRTYSKVTYNPGPVEYSYDENDAMLGPHSWNSRFAIPIDSFQSPIHLISCHALQRSVRTLRPLTFSHEYSTQPESVSVFNDSHTVQLYYRYCSGVMPKICGGPLKGVYKFLHATFRWGRRNDAGSEHSVNCCKFAMEMQLIHLKCEKRFLNLEDAVADGSILIISYLFEAGCADNPDLQPLVNAVSRISEPFTCTNVHNASPLSCIAPPFNCNYFAYCGSLTHPPCTEGVRWMIRAEPLSISNRQVAKFRKICGCHGPLGFNTRPVQDPKKRNVVYIS